MFQPNDPKVIENTKKRRLWEKQHPERNWKSGLSMEQIKRIEEERKPVIRA